MKNAPFKHMKHALALALTAAIVLSFLSACGGNTKSSNTDSPSTQEESGGRTKVVVGLGGTFESLTPVQNNDNRYGSPVMYTIYEVLAEAPKGGEGLQGVLLKDWSTDDYFTYHCVLYDYIVDSEGNKLTASDVKYSLDLAIEKAETYTNFIKSIDVENDTEFDIVMNTDAPGSFEMVVSNLYIFTEAAYEASDNGMAMDPVGTGPYICTYYAAGEKVIVEKNENYWQTPELTHPLYQSNVDVIEFQNIPEATQMVYMSTEN